MSIKHIAEKFQSIYETLDFDALDELLSDDFVGQGTHLPAPMAKAQFIGFLRLLNEACSEMNYNPSIKDIEATTFKLGWQLSAKHTGVLKLSAIGMQDFEPTNKTFSLPADEYVVTVKNDKVTHVFIDPPAGGGIQGVLKQLGLM